MARVSADVDTTKSDLSRRAASGTVLFFLTVGAVWWGFPIYHGFILVVSVIAALEWCRLCGSTEAWGGRAMVLAIGIIVPLAYLFGAGWTLLVISAAALVLLAIRPGETFWAGIGVFYIGLAAASAVDLRGDASDGALVVIWLIGIAVATDTGAYAGGKAIGGPKLAPRTSPNKTWSGAIMGVLAAGLIGGVVAWLMRGEPQALDWAMAILLSVVSQVGDLFESGVKRRYGQKDAGTLIPGHGGVLDRVDGMLFVLPVFALLSWLGLGLAL